ncbi:phosphonate ABC transporter, permease protein PhnE [Anaerosporobacter sp.]|uniref:phosphonate ABC transporter, permease protein PhnE n=1 Tax=Anaerosporobacter sp. TaxID=1872529 RepID=UPI00286F2D03|nr:phosphonate ABC transporter, permease protein PhnE [Anaerosporobacter sp.]
MADRRNRIAIKSKKESRQFLIIVLVVLALFVISSVMTKYKPWELLMNMDNFWLFIRDDLMPPKLAEPNMIVKGIFQTVSMAIAATLFATITSMILAFLGAKATCPWKPLRKIVRLIASVQRNIPNMIWIFVLIMAFGIGSVVGMLALLIQSTGFLTRAFIETIDEIGDESLEAMQSVGANRFTTTTQAIIPECLAGVVSWILYALEINIRSSTLVGAVGGGGIGLVMMGYIKLFRYHSAMATILLVAMIVIVVDLLTNFLRKKVLV